MNGWMKAFAFALSLIFVNQNTFAQNDQRRGRRNQEREQGRANIAPRSDSQNEGRRRRSRYEPFRPALQAFANEQAELKNGLPAQVLFLSEVLTDRLMEDSSSGHLRTVLHRENEVIRALDILMRERGKLPIIVGEPGAGKSEIINELALRVAEGNIPASGLYHEALDHAVVLKTSLRGFLPGGADLKAYLDTVKFIESNLGRKILVVLQECHFANDYHVSVLREIAEEKEPLPVVMEVDSKAFGNSIKAHPSFTSIAETIMARELKPGQVVDVLRSVRDNSFAEMYRVNVSDELLAAIADVSPDYRRDVAEPRRSITLLEDFMIQQNRLARDRAVSPSRIELYRFVAQQTGLPVIPQNEQEFANFMQGVKERMKQKIIGQSSIVDGVVDQFIAALTSRSRQHNIALLLGPTGVGKSLLGDILAEEFYGDKTRLLELDMTQYKDAHNMTSLFGANNGFVSSDKEKGVLCDFFDGRGKGGGIVILNEIEEMSSEALTRFMEMWDRGTFPGGDGKIRYVGRTLFILTSNKNADRILSYDAIRGMTRAELDRRLSMITQDQLKRAFTEKVSYTEDDSKTVKAAVLERIDRAYFASPLLKDESVRVANLEIERFRRDYHKQSVTRLNIDPSVAEVITSAFYNEALGARQIRTNVQQFLSQAINKFKMEHGFDAANLHISASLHPAMKTVSYIKVSDDLGNSLTFDGPKIPVKNRLLDPDFRARIVGLEDALKAEIFGQPEAVKAVAAGVKARFLEGENGTAVAGFLLGVTGSGKSELAKVLAKQLFGRSDAVGLFEMGRIQHESDLNTILSPGKGIIGSDAPGELERFLIQYPDGGVLLFDEMSNAGGGNVGLKQAIAKQFYTILQEGYYRSPSGKKYNLDNYIVLFTGNDGEEVFKGKQSDSLLEETYREAMKNRNFAKNLLSKAGFTDAFIGRLAFTVFMRPTLGDVKVQIAKKLIKEWQTTVQKTQPMDIELSPDLAEQVGRLMFSPKTGARSIREFVVNTLGPLVSDEALRQDWTPLIENGRRMKIKVSVSSVRPSQPFYQGDEPDKREAVIQAKTFIGSEMVSEGSIDFTRNAFFMPQASAAQAKATAYHEMGHAVLAQTKSTGKKVVKVTIVPESIGDEDEEISAAGYTQFRKVPHQSHPDYQFLIDNIAGLLAGSEAESKFLGSDKVNVGRSNDVQRAGAMAKSMILDLHLFPELDAAHAYADSKGDIVSNLPEGKKAKFDQFVDKAIEDGRQRAKELLNENWPLVQAGAEFLMTFDGNMSEHEYELLETAWRQSKTAGSALGVDFARLRHEAKAKCEESLAKSI